VPAVHEAEFTPLAVPRLGALPNDLRVETERARTRGYADGFAEGRAVARREAERQQDAQRERMRQHETAYLQERTTAVSALRASQIALEERVATLSELSVRRIEELAVELAGAILDAELSDPARSAAHALRRALTQTPISRWVRVTFDERDARTLRDDKDALAALAGVDVIAAAGLGVGGAIVDIDSGAVDTRIMDALRRAAAALDGDDDLAIVGTSA
jgi:flagellar assembly protein FliH